jgi:hypothetical protein
MLQIFVRRLPTEGAPHVLDRGEHA